jgi:hypothetical protein
MNENKVSSNEINQILKNFNFLFNLKYKNEINLETHITTIQIITMKLNIFNQIKKNIKYLKIQIYFIYHLHIFQKTNE